MQTFYSAKNKPVGGKGEHYGIQSAMKQKAKQIMKNMP